jgi:hypothetical protein
VGRLHRTGPARDPGRHTNTCVTPTRVSHERVCPCTAGRLHGRPRARAGAPAALPMRATAFTSPTGFSVATLRAPGRTMWRRTAAPAPRPSPPVRPGTTESGHRSMSLSTTRSRGAPCDNTRPKRALWQPCPPLLLQARRQCPWPAATHQGARAGPRGQAARQRPDAAAAARPLAGRVQRQQRGALAVEGRAQLRGTAGG